MFLLGRKTTLPLPTIYPPPPPSIEHQGICSIRGYDVELTGRRLGDPYITQPCIITELIARYWCLASQLLAAENIHNNQFHVSSVRQQHLHNLAFA